MGAESRTLLWLYTSYSHTCIQILPDKYTVKHRDSYLGQANQRGIPCGLERESWYVECFSSISVPAFLTYCWFYTCYFIFFGAISLVLGCCFFLLCNAIIFSDYIEGIFSQLFIYLTRFTHWTAAGLWGYQCGWEGWIFCQYHKQVQVYSNQAKQ